MTRALLTTARIAAALLLVGSARAQPPPDTTGASQAAVRLVEAAQGRDYPALVAFVNPQIVAELAGVFPATREQVDTDLRAMLDARGLDVSDSLLAAVRAPGPAASPDPDSGLRDAVRVYDWMGTLLDAGPVDVPALMARLLALSVACESESLLTLLDGVRYVPVRADVLRDGVVEVIGLASTTRDGEAREGLLATPLRWRDGRWTVAGVPPADDDAEIDPVSGILANDADHWFDAMVTAFAEPETLPACTGE